jgi:hypothetical protein
MAPNVFDGSLDTFKLLARFLARVPLAAKQAPPLVALLVLDEEDSIDRASNGSQPSRQRIIAGLDRGLLQVLPEPVLLLDIVEDGTADLGLVVMLYERVEEHLGVHVDSSESRAI